MNKLTPERIEEIINRLNGTAMSLDDALEDGEDPNDKQLTAVLDQRIFECTGCGWWCEMDEAHGDGCGGFVCDDCYTHDI